MRWVLGLAVLGIEVGVACMVMADGLQPGFAPPRGDHQANPAPGAPTTADLLDVRAP